MFNVRDYSHEFFCCFLDDQIVIREVSGASDLVVMETQLTVLNANSEVDETMDVTLTFVKSNDDNFTVKVCKLC